jgi:hypothetical protein
MKPLLAQNINTFLERFENFKDAEFRSLEMVSATNIKTTFALQDAARAFDWISLTLEFSEVIDASLVADNQLSHLDMSEGITLEFDTHYTFKIKNASFFLKAKTLKFEEGSF